MLSSLGIATTGAVVALVSAQQPAPPQGEEFGEASPIALVVIIVLALATALLIRNMTKRIKRLPESFDEPRAEDAAPGSGAAPSDAEPSEGSRAAE